jgi:hypothetical protein
MSKKITRRRFLILGGGAGLSAFLGGAYVVSACPLSDTGVCVGPCAAYVDRRGDGLCDRAYADRAMVQAVAQECGKEGTTTAEAPLTRCPLGLVNDPYPGECQHYIDQDGDGICDLSVPQDVGQASSQMPARVLPDKDDDAGPASPTPSPAPSVPQPQAGVACPFGLVDDPYPGQCRRYVDENGDGICDLSEPGSGLNAPEAQEGGQDRRRGWGNGRR